MATDYATLIPISIVTGFLGSGKTSLLRRLLTDPDLENTAVLINEFGEIGLDHHLIEHATESTLLLDNGCVCCAIREDLKDSVRELFSRRERGDVPRFERLVIETSGLADPVPIAYTVLNEAVIRHHFRLGNIITTVDAVNGNNQLDSFTESVKQIGVADHIILSKTDLCEFPQALRSLKDRIKSMNESAVLHDAIEDKPSAQVLIREDVHDPATRYNATERWLSQLADVATEQHDNLNHDVHSFCLVFDEPLDWTVFGIWLTMLLNRHGGQILRVKGMLNMLDVPHPVMVHGVQHLVHPPTHLDRWPDEDRRSRLVFILQGLSGEKIKSSLQTFSTLCYE